MLAPPPRTTPTPQQRPVHVERPTGTIDLNEMVNKRLRKTGNNSTTSPEPGPPSVTKRERKHFNKIPPKEVIQPNLETTTSDESSDVKDIRRKFERSGLPGGLKPNGSPNNSQRSSLSSDTSTGSHGSTSMDMISSATQSEQTSSPSAS